MHATFLYLIQWEKWIMPINTSMNRWSRIASNMDIETLSSNNRMGNAIQTPTGNPPFDKNVTGAGLSSQTNSLPRPPGDSFSESG